MFYKMLRQNKYQLIRKGKKMKYPNKDLIVKHNDLLESSYYLSYLQQKIMLLVISKIDNYHIENTLFDTLVTIDLKFDEILNVIYTDTKPSEKNIHSYVLKILKSLKDKTIILKEKDIEKKIETDTYTGWILKYKHEKFKSNIKVYLDPELKPYLLYIKEKFTQYHLQDVIKFQYTHSFRIYELCKQYQSIGKRIIPLDEFKRYLGITGKYQNYSIFKKRVLNPSIEDINSFSDLSVQYTTQRINKVPQSITFTMQSKTKQIPHSPSKIKALGISNDKQEAIFNRYQGFEKILEGKIDFILNRGEKVKHLPSYAYKCLMDEPLPEIKDIPILKIGMKIKSLKTEKIFTIEEGFVIRDDQKNIIAGEGLILDGIIQKRFVIS